MNQWLATLLSVVLLAAGLVAGATLFFVFLFVAAAFWLLFKARQLWARMTGRPVSPWVAGRFDPRNGFQRGFGSVRPRQPGAAPGARGQIEDVTDVVPRRPSDSDS